MPQAEMIRTRNVINHVPLLAHPVFQMYCDVGPPYILASTALLI